jgi:hypothetical protein
MMSKKILIILLLPIWAFAQNDTIKSNKENWTESDFSFKKERIKQRPTLEKKDNIIKTSVLPYAWGEVNLSFEKKMSNRTSLRIGAATALYNALLEIRTDSTQLSTFFISSDFRIYLGWKKANRGFYIAPHIQYRVMSYKSTTSKEITQFTGAGLLFGNQWIVNSFVYDLNAGIIATAFLGVNNGNTLYLPNLNFSVGYAF